MLFNEAIQKDTHTAELLGKEFIEENRQKLSLLFSAGYVSEFKECGDIMLRSFEEGGK